MTQSKHAHPDCEANYHHRHATICGLKMQTKINIISTRLLYYLMYQPSLLWYCCLEVSKCI